MTVLKLVAGGQAVPADTLELLGVAPDEQYAVRVAVERAKTLLAHQGTEQVTFKPSKAK